MRPFVKTLMTYQPSNGAKERGRITFVKAALTSEIPSGTMKAVRVGEKDVLIANVGGSYHSIGAICTHMKGHLVEGKLEGNIVTCPKHGSQFDVTNGKNMRGPKVAFLKLKTADEPLFQVKVEGSDILVNV